ncbi:MAG TPA: SpoIID/LytB domain-containing protein [Tepidisphaeraceae bacterium]|nr:SpoIID/LytB domain-containing protein [Tepidisphaeraceae bacterium]
MMQMMSKRLRMRPRTWWVLAGAVLGWAGRGMAQTIPSAIDSVTVTPLAGSYYTTNVTVPVEDNYLPNVVWRENGGASYQALKVQAVAARGYLYYKLSQTPNGGKATSIRDGTADQVYSKSPTAPFTRATATSTQMNYLRAADESEGEILITSAGEPVCMFYVAAGRPDTSTDASTIWPMGAALGKWETGDQDPTGTEHWVTYNRGLTGASVQPTPLGSLTNPVNRGAMSQNGSSFLGAGRTSATNPERNFAAWDYVDIIKYYYGQDTQLALAKAPASGEMPAFVKQIASFDYDEGYLRNRMDYSTTNSANILYGSSSHVRDLVGPQSGAGSQRIVLDIDAAAASGNFTYRHMSGMVMGTEANPTINDGLIGTKSANLLIENRGSVGFWIKTTAGNVTARPLLDDGAASTEQGVARNIVGDGQWHKYEWYLTDNPEWTSFAGGNNAISGNWTLDSILFTGAGNTTLNLDTVFYDASTTPPVNQWVFDGNGTWGVAGNWVNAVPDNVGAVANFLGKTSGRRVVTIASPVSVGTINFNQPLGYEVFNNSVTFLGLTLDVSNGSAAINVQSSGTQTISSGLNIRDNATIAVVGGGTLVLSGVLNIGAVGVGKIVTKTGGGILTINGAQLHQPGTVIVASGGVTNINSNCGVNAALSVIGSGSSVVLGADQDLRDLNVAFGDGGVQTLDLKSGSGAGVFRSVRVFAGDLAGVKNSLYAAVANAISNPGDGIVDSSITSHPGSAIGVAVVGDHVLVRPTRMGDLNLDGSVTISDFIDLASNFNGVGTWQEGDLNYDGSVTISDFIDLAANFNSSYAGEVWPIGGEDRAALEGFAAANVPEPGVILSVMGVGLMLKRKTRARRPCHD